MNSLFRGASELKIDSSILTRRGGTDANAPESPQEAIPRDRHVGIFGTQFLENPGKCAFFILLELFWGQFVRIPEFGEPKCQHANLAG